MWISWTLLCSQVGDSWYVFCIHLLSSPAGEPGKWTESNWLRVWRRNLNLNWEKCQRKGYVLAKKRPPPPEKSSVSPSQKGLRQGQVGGNPVVNWYCGGPQVEGLWTLGLAPRTEARNPAFDFWKRLSNSHSPPAALAGRDSLLLLCPLGSSSESGLWGILCSYSHCYDAA